MSAQAETKFQPTNCVGSLQGQLAFEQFQGCSPRDVFSQLQSWDTDMAGQPWLWVLTSDRLQAAYEGRPDEIRSIVTSVSDHLADLLAQPDQFERNQQLTVTIISLYRNYRDHSKESIRCNEAHECVQDHLRTLVGKTLLADTNNVSLLFLEERRNLFEEARDQVNDTHQALTGLRNDIGILNERELRQQKDSILVLDSDQQDDLLEALSENLPFLLYLASFEEKRPVLLSIGRYFTDLNEGQFTDLSDSRVPSRPLLEPIRRKPDDRQLPILVRATDMMEEVLTYNFRYEFFARRYLQFPQRPPGDIKQMISQLQRLGPAINHPSMGLFDHEQLSIRDLMFDRIDAVLLRIAQRYDPAYAPDNPQWRAVDDRDVIDDDEHILPESEDVGRLFLTVAQYEDNDLCKHLFSLCSHTGVNLRSAVAGFINALKGVYLYSEKLPPGVKDVLQYLDDIQSNPDAVPDEYRIDPAIVSHKIWPGKYRYDHAAHIRDDDKEAIQRYLAD